MASQVAFIGDSYSSYAIAHTDISALVQARAIKDGALPMGMRYINDAVPGTTLGVVGAQIPGQWEAIKGRGVKVVVMDGGGNDVLIDHTECLPDGSQKMPGCQKVVADSLAAAMKMWASMKAAGVADVIWFWYPHIPGALQGTGHDMTDYAWTMLVDAAKAATDDTFRVKMIDTVPLFNGHDDYYFPDGIHANDKGSNVIADAIWMYMKDNCIGQAAASMCCKP